MNTLTTFFEWLLTASFRASVLTLVVLGVQLIFRKKLGARARYALWLPVLVVLLTPVLPQSRWSLENLFVKAPQTVLMPQTAPAAQMAVSLPSVEITTPMPKAIDWPQIGLFAWMSIAAAFLLFGAFSFFRTMKRFQRTKGSLSDETTALIQQIAREVGLKHAPRVWCSSAITSPAVTGFFRPVLLLPADFDQAFTAPEARLILQHELTHVKRHDLPLNALLCTLMALHWFNPLLWLAFYKVRLDREAACDAQVLENAPPQRRVEYGHALLKAETAFAPLKLSLGFVGLFHSGAALRSRIQSIAHHQPSHPAMKLITLASIGLMTFLGITRAAEPSNVIGKTEFRPGDSIRITNVQRGDNFLTVTAEYELASEPQAIISLHITRTKGDGRSKTAASQSKTISKGKGTVTLHHPDVGEGMPHVSFYPAKGGSVFGGIYFGTAAEAAASQKMKWSMAKSDTPKANPLEAKLTAIIFPVVQFRDATIAEAVEFLRVKSRDLDTTSTDPAQKGVNILVRGNEENKTRITLNLREVPLGQALRYVVELAGLEMRMEPYAVLVAPKATSTPRPANAEAASPILLPQVEFREATLDEALEFIRAKSRDVDPDKKGVNILRKPGGADVTLSLSLKQVPVNEALRYIAELAKHQLTLEGNTFILTPVK
jgi:beta-lactamase regulating signal transducer with metallopeptidase domain